MQSFKKDISPALTRGKGKIRVAVIKMANIKVHNINIACSSLSPLERVEVRLF